MRISDWSSDVCYSDLKQALLTLLARRELSRGAVGGTLEVHVAQAALAALGHQHAVAVARHVADDLVGGDVDDLGADRDDDGGVLAALAVALLAHAVLAALRAEPLLRSEERHVGKECVRTCRFRGWP